MSRRAFPLLCFAAGLLTWLCAMPLAGAEPIKIAYVGKHQANDNRFGYYVDLLGLALHKAGAEYELVPKDTPMIGPRLRQVIDSHGGIDITWAPTSQEQEDELLPIRIPIDKGILGWRLLLIKSSDRQLFAHIQTLEQLKSVNAGLRRFWVDIDVLRANGLPVVEGALYHDLFPMLKANRFQYFPRGVGEIWGEQESHADLGLEVEPHLALHYPANTYFFVAHDNARLAGLIEKGLRTAMRDGSFDKLFEQYNGEAIKRANLRKRTVFELKNPLVPETKPVLNDSHPIH